MWRALSSEALGDGSFKSFKADGLKLQYLGNVVCGEEGVLISEPHQHLMSRIMDELQLRFQHDDAGSFSPHQRARHVESVLR